MTNQPQENIHIQAVEQFNQEAGVTVPPGRWRPINTTIPKLDELKSQINSTRDNAEKLNKALAFIDSNAESNVSGVPRAAVATAVAGAATVAATEGSDSISAAVGDTVKQGMREFGEEVKKKGFFGTLMGEGGMKEAIAGGMKGLIEAKKEGGIGGIFANLGIFLMKMFGDMFKVDLSSVLTPEELKELGMTPTQPGVPTTTTAPAPAEGDRVREGAQESLMSEQAYRVTTTFLIRGNNKQTYTNVLDAAYSGFYDATVGSDEKQKKEFLDREAVNLLMDSRVRTLSYASIISMSKELLAQKVQSNDPSKPVAAGIVIDMLKKNQGMLNGAFSGEQGWKDLPIESLLSKLYKEKGLQYVDELQAKIENLDIENIATLPNNTFLGIKLEEGRLILGEGPMSARLQSLEDRGLTKRLIQKLHFEDNNAESSAANFMSRVDGMSLDQKEVAFLRELTDSNGFMNSLKQSLIQQYGYDEQTISYLLSSNITMRDLLDLYAITGGKGDVNSLNMGESSLLVTKLQAFFLNNHPTEFGIYMKKILENAAAYPKIVQTLEIINTTVNKGAYKIAYSTAGVSETIIKVIESTIGIDTQMERVGAIGALGGTIALALRMLPISRVIGFIVMILAGLGLIGGAAAQQNLSNK